MIPAQFDYIAPATIEEALVVLGEKGDEAKIIAGGQSLLPVLRMRLNAPETIIDLGRIESLRGVREDGDAIVVSGEGIVARASRHPFSLTVLDASGHTLLREATGAGKFNGRLMHIVADTAGARYTAVGEQPIHEFPRGGRQIGIDDPLVPVSSQGPVQPVRRPGTDLAIPHEGPKLSGPLDRLGGQHRIVIRHLG